MELNSLAHVETKSRSGSKNLIRFSASVMSIYNDHIMAIGKTNGICTSRARERFGVGVTAEFHLTLTYCSTGSRLFFYPIYAIPFGIKTVLYNLSFVLL